MVRCLHQHLRILPQHAAQNNTITHATVLSGMLSAEHNKASENLFGVRDQEAFVWCFHTNPDIVSQVNNV